MYIPNRQPRLRSAPARAGFAFAGLLPLLGGQAQAVEFSFWHRYRGSTWSATRT
ncbi:hypothetical protein, partial [Pseudomonas aeruginosa]|uniref:hypothetical protein n=1 Tax=Pseudomonas aeruginosa TaxID=287 RepID=UPI00396A1DE7